VNLAKSRRFVLFKNAVKRILPGDYSWPAPWDDSAEMDKAPPVVMDWPSGVPKPRVGLVRDRDVVPYWTKYRNFLEANEIDYRLFDIHRSTWLDEASEYDMVLWRPMSFPYELEECRRKVYLLERHLGKVCYPSLDEALLYEDKILQYHLMRLRGLPVIDTFISQSSEEALGYLRRRGYPAVWKLAAGSGSFGVQLVPNARSARRWARQVFSFSGRRTYWPYIAQKDYVYVQSLEPNQGFDLRVVIVGDKAVGYYRHVPDHEFRASGMGLVEKTMLPPEAVRLARRAAEALDAPCLAVDLLVDPSGQRLQIIELSAFIQMSTPRQLLVDGVPGVLVGDECRFEPLEVWIQELALQRVLERRWIPRFGDP
jgi:glutathione synthase/RimK-type ligase-like ATP-grasp enzyme